MALKTRMIHDRQRRGRPATPRTLGAALSLAALLAAAMPGQARAQGGEPVGAGVGAGAQWTVPGGDPQGTRFSKLSDITPANAATLTEEFAFPTGRTGNHEGQPLVIGTTMYLVTPFPHELIALDLKHPGTRLWTYTPPGSVAARAVACCDLVNRGPTYANGMIVMTTLDNHVAAVNAATGKQVWIKSLGSTSSGQTLTGSPIVADGVVVVGNAGGELGVRGWVVGLDLATGAEKWRAYSTGPDAEALIGPHFHAYYAKDQGKDLGVKTWPGTLWKEGGATVWNWITYDPELDLIFYGTGNPGVWNPDMRPGDNKWGASVFARKPATGEAVWAYQLTPHDGWDFDSISEMISVDQKYKGALRKLLVHFDKNGFAYTWDRATGEVLTANPWVNVTWASHIDLATGLPDVNPGMRPHRGVRTTGICPTPLGGKDYLPAAFSPGTGLFYVPSNNLCFDIEPLKAVYIKGAPFTGVDIGIAPGPGGHMGELVAWDAVQGKRAWSIKEPLPVYGGVLATAGGVVFYGTLDKHFKGVDASTGKVLLDKVLECGIGSDPISYSGPDGKQRVAVFSGTGWLDGGFAGGSCPHQDTGGDGGGGGGGAPAASTSGMLHVFRLP